MKLKVKTTALQIGDYLWSCESSAWGGYRLTALPAPNPNSAIHYRIGYVSHDGRTYNDSFSEQFTWEIERGDPRTWWTSEDGEWAVARLEDIKTANIMPLPVVSYGYGTPQEAVKCVTVDYPKDYADIVANGRYPNNTPKWFLCGGGECFSKIKRLDLPWERNGVTKKVLSAYPSKCIYCNQPCYIGGNSIDHEPGKAAANCPAR